MPNNNHNNNNRKRENSHNNHYNRFRGRNRHRDNYENKENGEVVEVRENNRENNDRRDSRDARENREHRDNRENRNNRDNQVINSFTLGTKELEGKNAEFQYDKGWYSIIDIVDEEKNVIYKSKNAQEAYTKWNVYIGRKKERSSKVEKTE